MRKAYLAFTLSAAVFLAAGCTSESSAPPAPKGPGDMPGKPSVAAPKVDAPKVDSPKVDPSEVPTVEEAKTDAAGMDRASLEKAIDNTAAMIASKEKEATDLLARLKDFSPADLLTEKVKTINASKDHLLQEVAKLKEILAIYKTELSKKS